MEEEEEEEEEDGMEEEEEGEREVVERLKELGLECVFLLSLQMHVHPLSLPMKKATASTKNSYRKCLKHAKKKKRKGENLSKLLVLCSKDD